MYYSQGLKKAGISIVLPFPGMVLVHHVQIDTSVESSHQPNYTQLKQASASLPKIKVFCYWWLINSALTQMSNIPTWMEQTFFQIWSEEIHFLTLLPILWYLFFFFFVDSKIDYCSNQNSQITQKHNQNCLCYLMLYIALWVKYLLED